MFKQLLASITGTQKISVPMTIVIPGIAKMFVGEVVETVDDVTGLQQCVVGRFGTRYSVPSWPHSCILIFVTVCSLGSITSWKENELIEVAYDLANSEQKFLWVIRPETIKSIPEEVKSAAREKGRIVKWARQREVLAQGKLFISPVKIAFVEGNS
ncbi:hypothetical protein Ahy_A02g005213 [Arachis hypogaea]|uniref:TAFII28-like protein domain-containing protein n=1 Tax=Arachis hypogaea TaxID=3818 RepID=A0A445E609_ARAHY|nr:hypothetical protein Ahy_A02g005213 [Arachis hypogaea]